MAMPQHAQLLQRFGLFQRCLRQFGELAQEPYPVAVDADMAQGRWLRQGAGILLVTPVRYGGAAEVQGHALRISAALLFEEFNRAGALMQVLLVYTQSLLTQVGQIGVCNSYHDADQKLCRWLLLRLDRQADTTVEMTQDLISQMLGVRRMSVTSAVAHLESSGLIQCSRGHITVLDRAAIEARCCECYRVVTREHQRLFRSAR